MFKRTVAMMEPIRAEEVKRSLVSGCLLKMAVFVAKIFECLGCQDVKAPWEEAQR
jgi:hypothetical protein